MLKDLPKNLIFLSYASLFFGLTSAYLKFLAPFTGFLIFLLGIALSLIAMLFLIVTGIWTKNYSSLIQALYALPVLVLIGIYVYSRSAQPMLNDVSNNLNSPAKFINTPKELADLNSAYTDVQKKLLSETYPDLAEFKYNFPCFRIYEESLRIINDTPSASLQHTAQEPYRIQYTQSSSVFKFVDDIAIQLNNGPDKTCHLSMRSRSRDGKSDFGANFKRILTFNGHLKERLQNQSP